MNEFGFYVPSDTKYVISQTFFPANLLVSWLTTEKTKSNTIAANMHAQQNISQQKPKLKLGLVASYDIQPGNGTGLFWKE